MARCTASGTRRSSTSRQYDLAFDRPCQDHVHGVMDALERISRHDLGLDLPFLIQLEKIGNRCIHDVRLHLEMDVEWGTNHRNVFEKHVVSLDLGNASGGKPDDHHAT